MIKQDISEKRAKKVFLAIGSNLGNKIINIEKAKYKLQNNFIRILKSSNWIASQYDLFVIIWVSHNSKSFELAFSKHSSVLV